MRIVSRASVLVAALVFALAPAAQATPSEEAQFVAFINDSRAAAGLAPLSSYNDLIDDARRHTADMIAEGTIFHSSNSALAGATTGWSLLGENVGMGPDPGVLHSAFMASATHKANILGAFDRVGVGAERAPDGTLFVTVMFMQTTPTTPTTPTTIAPPPPPPAASSPAPVPVAVPAPVSPATEPTTSTPPSEAATPSAADAALQDPDQTPPSSSTASGAPSRETADDRCVLVRHFGSTCMS